MEFEYAYVETALARLEVEDVGNVAISVSNTVHEEYILIIKTEYGKSKILTFGPWVIDSDIILPECGMSYKEIDFKERRLIKIIEAFLNNINVTEAEVIDFETAMSRVRDIRSYM